MFLRRTNYDYTPEYLTPGTVITETYDAINYQTSPRNDVSVTCGVSLVVQYIESMKFRTAGHYKMPDNRIAAIHARALEIDETYEDLDETSDEYPTLDAIMAACYTPGNPNNIVENITKIGFIRPSVNDIKYFTRQYGGIILELKLTSTTYNAVNFQITSAGELLNEDFSKGVITAGYDDTYLYIQNSKGLNVGSLGYHRIAWNIVPDIVYRGAVFHVTNDILK